MDAETVDRSCETFYHPTQCLVSDVTDEGGPAKERICYCNVDYCNSARADVTYLKVTTIVTGVFVTGKLTTNLRCG